MSKKGGTRARTKKATIERTTVRVLPPAHFVSKKKKKTRQRRTAPRPRSVFGSRQYECALRNPFLPEAIGCRVPDSYAIPTATYHVRGSLSLTSDATGSIGYLFLPSPCFSALKIDGTDTGMVNFAQNAYARYVLSPTSMANVLTEYRTVAWGIRLVPKDTVFASKGKFYLATVPTTANAPSWNTLETVSAASVGVIAEYTCGLAFNTGTQVARILNLPSVRTFTAQDMMRGEVIVTGLPLSSSFYDFRGTTDRSSMTWNTNQVLADEGVFNNTTGLVNATAGGRKDVASLRGGMAIALYATGLPGATNEFDVEYIYHLEGTPNITTDGGGQLVPSAMKPMIGSTHVVESILAAAHAAGKIVSFLPDPFGSAGRAVAGFADHVSTKMRGLQL